MNIGLNNFVSGGADEALLKSLATDERYQDNDELAKALKKEGLVQVQTTVNSKHGTYTRMQWKRASDVKSTDRVVGQQKPAGQDGGHQTEKPQAARLQNFKVDKTTTPATATFEFKGKKYTATEGKNLTLQVQTTGGGQDKISGKLKLTDGGYPRIGSYPVEGLDNILGVSAKEVSGESKEAPKEAPKTEKTEPKNTTGKLGTKKERQEFLYSNSNDAFMKQIEQSVGELARNFHAEAKIDPRISVYGDCVTVSLGASESPWKSGPDLTGTESDKFKELISNKLEEMGFKVETVNKDEDDEGENYFGFYMYAMDD